MIRCFFSESLNDAIPIHLIQKDALETWLAKKSNIKTWLSSIGYKSEIGETAIIHDNNGKISEVIVTIDHKKNLWQVGHLPYTLPAGHYYFVNVDELLSTYALGFGLGAYQFNRYKKPIRESAKLYVPEEKLFEIMNQLNAIYLVRDLINTPTEDMGPTELSNAASELAKEFGAIFSEVIGEDLCTQQFNCIYTVGRASDDAPRLLDLRWGKASHPKITLVGKGVCFDSGGLDLKPSAYMQLMKKDMGGAAHVLGLARMIMAAQLPICLRVLIPAVENVISGNAYRPGDVIKTKKGITVEIGNTDAEGRLVLADALTEALKEKPSLLIDIATLTGAARVALGTECPAVFSNDDKIVGELTAIGSEVNDPMWRLPLFEPYREYLNSQIADINNNSSEVYGGAITAALFLKEFVPDNVPWLHFDLMAWNMRPKPGRPQGGEAGVLRALFAFLQKRYA